MARVAIVTGGTRGIGAAISVTLKNKGFSVAAIYAGNDEAATAFKAETGIPVYNVNNNCSTGSTALFMGKQFVEGGLADCTMALGFEKMEKGSLIILYKIVYRLV